MRETGSAVVITTSGVSIEDVRSVVDGARVELGRDAIERLRRGREVVDALVEGDTLFYGLNTLLGHMRDERVSVERLQAYQVDMINGHRGGIGEPLPDDEVRALMLARIAGAAGGGSGLEVGAVETIAKMLNAGVHPVVPEVGSVGASDLMHMAAVAAVVIGGGRARVSGEVLDGGEALARAGIEPHVPGPKEGLALLSANGYSVGVGALGVLEAERVALIADLVGALCLETVRGNPSPFDDEVARAKPFPGQIESAAAVRAALEGSYLFDPAAELSVQDPLSLRTIPQVHGALREQIGFARRSVEIELNSMDDNPLVSIERGTLISNGNFHPMVLALAFDALRTGLAHVGMISERRMNKIMASRGAADPKYFLGPDDGPRRPRRGVVLYPAAAVLAELKHLASPVTIHCPPLDFDVEDHATLAPTAVALTRRAIGYLETVLAAEALMAVDLLATLRELPRLGAGTGRLREEIEAALRGLDSSADSAEAVAATRAALVALTS